jgi:hypothetical protein
MNMKLTVTDLTNPDRVTVVDGDSIGAVLAEWLRADGAAGMSPNVARLVRALHRGDWATVHAVADHLSMDVEAAL